MFARILIAIALLFPSFALADDLNVESQHFDIVRATSPDMTIHVHSTGAILVAQADTGSNGTMLTDSSVSDGSAVITTSGSAAVAPADKLHDPVSSPGASWDDLKAAKKVGWPLAVFAGLIMFCRLLARAKKYKLAAFLSKGKTPVVVAMIGAVAIACFNAAAEGGAWTAVFVAGVTAIAHYRDAHDGKESEG